MTESLIIANRINSLAQPKKIRCIPPRSSYSLVSRSTLNFNTTDRLISLSLPKIKNESHIRTEFSRFAYDATNSCVFNKAALKAECSDHVFNLSRPKLDYKGYKFALPVERPISTNAKNAVATERIIFLSTPRIKKDNNN